MKGIRIVLGVLFALMLCPLALASGPGDIGIVLMHGKQGSPAAVINRLANRLASAGYRVSTPTMPWSRNRIYEKTVDDSMLEIDREGAMLRKEGARKMIIAGQSLGANAAIRYAATRKKIDGLIALAPGHSPESSRMRKLFADDVERAKEKIEEGNVRQAILFHDGNMGRRFQIYVRPDVYLSWMAPDGPAVMPKNAASIRTPIPILYVVGSLDPWATPKDRVFDRAPFHPKSRFVTVSADHLGVPSASIEVALDWLKSISK
jgi:pimeloyl-ACP methyl ester carboxylesterase